MTSEKKDIVLDGCGTEPLSNYLKALGVFRLVSEQADPEARGYWKNGVFALQTKLNAEELENFFLNQYAPTPIISPWNRGSGFNTAKEELKQLLNSDNTRLTGYRDAIAKSFEVVKKAEDDGLRPFDKQDKNGSKEKLIKRLRNELPDEVVRWIDAVLVITSDKKMVGYAPLIGTGGNDAKLDFSIVFMKHLNKILPFKPDFQTQVKTRTINNHSNSCNLIENALFGFSSIGITEGKFGQFNPSAAGNFNASNNFTCESYTNSWDYVLAIEGALIFASAAVRRYENKHENTSMSFPFSVRSSASGYGTAVNYKPSNKGNGEKARNLEVWLPTWRKAASYKEIEQLFSEGRAEFGNRSAHNVIEFAQTVTALGTDRGLTEFHRYGFFERNGQAHFAVKLDTLGVRGDRNAELLREPIEWVGRSRRSKDSDAKAKAIREIEENLLRLCHRGFENPEPAMETIAALGRLMQESVKRKDGLNLKPSQVLAAGWLEKADDGSPEFRLAASLASLLTSEFSVLFKTRQTDFEKRIAKDTKKWLLFSGKPAGLLNVIMADRILRLKQKGSATYSEQTKIFAHLDDVNTFMAGILDYRKLIDLAFGLMFLKWKDVGKFEFKAKQENEQISREKLFPGATYALAKLCHTGIEFDWKKIRLIPAVHKRMASGSGRKALEIALRRLRADGCRIPNYGDMAVSELQCERIAAALLFPLDYKGIKFIKDRILEREEV